MRTLAPSARRPVTAAAFAAATLALPACGSSSVNQPLGAVSMPSNAPTASNGLISVKRGSRAPSRDVGQRLFEA